MQITNTDRYEKLSSIVDEIWEECRLQQNTLEWANQQFMERVARHPFWEKLPERYVARLCERHNVLREVMRDCHTFIAFADGSGQPKTFSRLSPAEQQMCQDGNEAIGAHYFWYTSSVETRGLVETIKKTPTNNIFV